MSIAQTSIPLFLEQVMPDKIGMAVNVSYYTDIKLNNFAYFYLIENCILFNWCNKENLYDTWAGILQGSNRIEYSN